MRDGASDEITKHQDRPKDSSGAGADSTPHEARAHKPRNVKPEPEEIAMYRNRNNQPFELTSDMTELALLACASPELVERYLAELFGAAPASETSPATNDKAKTLIAA
jgi:hypothetical protein